MTRPWRCPANTPPPQYGHSSVVDPLGNVIDEADEHEAIIYADIDPELLATTRRNLPVTIQRRFDVYADVSKTAPQ